MFAVGILAEKQDSAAQPDFELKVTKHGSPDSHDYQKSASTNLIRGQRRLQSNGMPDLTETTQLCILQCLAQPVMERQASPQKSRPEKSSGIFQLSLSEVSPTFTSNGAWRRAKAGAFAYA
jgi:hypothetical protein